MTMTMQQIRFGIEIEFTGSQSAAAQAIMETVPGITGTTERYGYTGPRMTDPQGRTWKIVNDPSVYAGGEFVSPPLTLEDLPTLQAVVRAMRRKGCRSHQSAGIHIHIDGAHFSRDPKALKNLVKMINKQEQLLMAALGTSANRINRWCGTLDAYTVDRIAKARTPDQIRSAYGNTTRYKGVNLQALYSKGTIEFRFFDSTMHAGKIKAYIQFILALAAKAINAKQTSARKRAFNRATAKYDFRVFMLRLGLIGDEYKTCRKHMMANLEGSAAWKHGRPAQAD